MVRSSHAAILIAAILFLGACGPSNDNVRVIESAGPVFEVKARGGTAIKPVAQSPGRGTLVLEGGGSYLDAVSELTVAYAGPKPVLCLIDTAADGKGDPYDRFDAYEGVDMLTLNITPDTADDPKVLEALNHCTGYYFNGGNPELLSKGLIAGGKDSPALAVIRKHFDQAGAVVAGTSAGAMIAGPVTLCECSAKSSIAALTKGVLYQAQAYHFSGDVLIEAHFFTKGLIGRDLYALAKNRSPASVGIDETTAVVVPGDGGLWRIIGSSSVAFIQRGPGASVEKLKGFTLSLLNAGDRFDPLTGHVAMSPDRKQQAPISDPVAGPLQMGGVFDPDAFRKLIVQFALSPNPVAQGYAEAEGLVITLRKRADTTVYGDAGAVSVLNLDVEIGRF
jgi:cyanophycinase-like exopeptidase